MKKWLAMLAAAVLLVTMTAASCAAEGSAANVPGGYILITDTLPETLKPVFSGAEWADDTPVAGGVFSRFDEWNYAQVIMHGDTGYTLCCLLWMRDQQQWLMTASSAAIPQGCAPEIVYEELTWGLDEEERDQYNIGYSFRLVYPAGTQPVSEQSWFCGSDGWQLQGMVIGGQGVVTGRRELTWGDESVYNMRDISLEGFVLADFPKTIDEARALAAADPVLNDNTAGITAATEKYGMYNDITPAFPIWADDGRWGQIGWGFAHTQVEVLETAGDLAKVRIDGVVGWIPRECVKIGLERSTEFLSQERGRVLPQGAAEMIPLYAAPDSPDVTGYADVHTVVGVTMMSMGGEWMQIRTGEASGWVESDMIGLTDNYATCTVVNDAPERRLHLRAAPSSKAESLGKYYSGVVVDMLWQEKEYDGWRRVSIEGVSGWMSTKYLSFASAGVCGYLPPMGEADGPKGVVNLREGPGYGYHVLAELPDGTKAEILGISGDWAHVRLKEGGVTGYMLLDYLGGAPARAVTAVKLLTDAPNATDSAVIPAGTKVQIEERPREQWLWVYLPDGSDTRVFGMPETVFVYSAEDETGAHVPPDAVDCGW